VLENASLHQVTLQEKISFPRTTSGAAKSIVFVNEKEKVFIFFNSTMSLRFGTTTTTIVLRHIHEESREQTALVFLIRL